MSWALAAAVVLGATGCEQRQQGSSGVADAGRLGPTTADAVNLQTSGETTAVVRDPAADSAMSPLDVDLNPEFRARVTKVVDPGAGSCGRVHTVGAIEVEVLDVAAPRQRLELYVSCPRDLRPRGMLGVGKTLVVRLFDHPQRWPKPANPFAPTATPHYVRKIVAAE